MIEIVSPGLFTTIQDLGRWGYQEYGMPVAGAMDRYAYQVANILVGNDQPRATLEMTMLGGKFKFSRDCYASVCGADMQGMLDGNPITNWSCFFIAKGSELAFGYAAVGCRAYLAIHGGIDVPCVLDSFSTYTRGSIGGHKGRALQSGDELAIGEQSNTAVREFSLPAKFVPKYSSNIQLRVLLGPQDDLFTMEGINTLFSGEYEITSEADRMGYRLEGPSIEHRGKADIVSDALPLGAIQVPASGKPIIMMADRQTTGGYTKIGTIIGPDLMFLAQGKPGDKVKFVNCLDDAAVNALKTEQANYPAIRDVIQQNNQLAPEGTHYKIRINEKIYDVTIKER